MSCVVVGVVPLCSPVSPLSDCPGPILLVLPQTGSGYSNSCDARLLWKPHAMSLFGGTLKRLLLTKKKSKQQQHQTCSMGMLYMYVCEVVIALLLLVEIANGSDSNGNRSVQLCREAGGSILYTRDSFYKDLRKQGEFHMV